jgi:hypothetical protein
MNSKLTLLLGALLSAAPLLAQAPDPNQSPAIAKPQSGQWQSVNHPPERDPAKQAAHLGKQLGLSSNQVEQLTPILADRQQQMQNLRADGSLSRKARRAKAKALQQDSSSRIEAVLNDSQKQQYQQILAEHRNHRNRQPQS